MTVFFQILVFALILYFPVNNISVMLNQNLAADTVSCSRTQHSDSCRVITRCVIKELHCKVLD